MEKTHLTYLDFDLEIGFGHGRDYPIAVLRSPAGEARETMHFPYGELALESRLKDLQIALLRSGVKRRQVLSTEEQAIHDFGRDLFEAMFTGEVRSRYDLSLDAAVRQKKGLRLKLRIQPPELATLPWEFLYDPREAEYICLSRATPVVRYLELPHSIPPLSVKPPLRILGMIASPNDLLHLDLASEKQRIERAVRGLQVDGLVDMTWLDGQTWRDLQRAMQSGPWHIFHFIGHGGFDRVADEGFIALADDGGETQRLSATHLARLLADHQSLRLVLLNSCEGARGGQRDVFSSTASIVARRGIPAVLAMQDEITDEAAIEFARAFYEAVASGMPVDAAVAEARKAISFAVTSSMEWGTPVLWMRSPDGVLFDISKLESPRVERPPLRENPAGAAWSRLRYVLPLVFVVLMALGLLVGLRSGWLDGIVGEPTSVPTTVVPETLKQVPTTISSVPVEQLPTPTSAPSVEAVHLLTTTSTVQPTDRPTSEPVIGPVGRLAMVRRSENDNREIFVMDLGSGDERQITTTPNNKWSWAPAWSPDGRLIALSSRASGKQEVHIVPASGGVPARITNTPDGEASGQPTWSADSRSLIFQSSRDGIWQLYRLDIPEAVIERLSRREQPEIVFDQATAEQLTWEAPSKFIPGWSPTGSEALFAGQVEGVWRIFKIHLDTGEIVRLSSGPGDDYAPSWSPDGSQIAFQTDEERQVGQNEIYIMDTQGSNRRRLTHTPDDKWSRAPTWSPDGQWLAYVSNRDESAGTDFGDVYVVNISTGEVKRLTFGGEVYDWRLSWATP